MKLYTGHPRALKEAFFDFLGAEKQNPFEAALVVLPSRRLEAALKRGAARRAGCVSAVYFTDFLRLALDIRQAGAAPFKPLLPDNARQDFALKNILQKYGMAHGRGYVAALKKSLRDLAAAQVSVGDLMALKEEENSPLSAEQKEYIARTAVVYNDYTAALKTEHYDNYYEVFRSAATAAAAGNAYLKRFRHIIFYGFYDFTALQFELFKALRESCGITVFFPYEDNPAYKFARGFYEGNILPAAKNIIALPPPQSAPKNLADKLFDGNAQQAAPEGGVRVISVSGAAAEVEAAAKEILRLKENEGLDFCDIALCARSMEPYKNDILPMLAQNKIPCNAAFETPLAQHPLGAFIFNLLHIEKNNFYRDDVLAVVTSPYFKNRNAHWPAVIKNTGITCGYAQWQDLLPLCDARAHAPAIAAFLAEIKGLLSRLGAAAPFEQLCTLAAEIIEKYTISEGLSPAETAAMAAVKNLLAQIESFKEIRPMAAAGEFLEEFAALLRGCMLGAAAHAREGVEVADIMALRGRDFKAVVIMGLNEGLLPAPAREDPALKDVYRKALRDIGFMIRTRADRYDEEKLLFYFALSCAGSSASLIYQRSGEDGKPKIPSLYLLRALALLGRDLGDKQTFVLSRRPQERYGQWPAALLNRREAALLCALGSGAGPRSVAAVLQADASQNALLEAADTLNSARALTRYDGVVNADNAAARALKTRGISPSDLQVLFKCPARALFDRITSKDEERPLLREGLAPLAKGTLYHEMLENFHKHLKQNNLSGKISPAAAREMLKDFLRGYLHKDDYKKYGVYPLAWDAQRAQMAAALEHFVEEDFKLLREGGFEPLLFEEKMETEILLNGAALKLRGKLDRVDVSSSGKTYRIIDYKTKRESAEIKRAVFERAVLQPPLYFEMAAAHPALKDKTPHSAALLAIEAQGAINKDLAYDDYLAVRPKFAAVLEYLTQLVNDGVFIITPCETACKNCRYETLCRKNHHGSLRRARAAEAAKKLGEMHEYR
ncbi:MAG: PD-(D/E)XK nuclease family protein [Elusimicrobiota bacterium]|jgi:ATP-dependent helicase/nuclease subunit B|nr:PD-(D/E)XK nuclease family protein [Elusimicrobiota bacterium]